jgi:dolichol-phosphate mannosyltransferase
MKKKLNLGIVTPFGNERQTARCFVSAVLSVCSRYPFNRIEMYAILDGVCVDGTYDILCEMAEQEPRLRVIWAPENRCVVDAYMRGYKEALDQDNDWILEIDSGFSHDPEQIPLFFSEMAKAPDCVFGVRFGLTDARFEGKLNRRLISQGGSMLSNALLGTRIKDMTGGFELFSKKALQYILKQGIHSRGPFFQTEIRTYAHALNFIEVPIRYDSPSHNIGGNALLDAFAGLWRLYKKKRNEPEGKTV